MAPSAVLLLIAQYGPNIVSLIGQLVALKDAGDKPLTAADFQQLQKYASKTAADYLAEAGGAPQK